MARTEGPRLAILGAGPVGLEAAVYAAALRLPFTVYERGKVGDYVRHWGHVRLFTPFGMNASAAARAALRAENPRVELPADNDLLTGRDHVARFLEPLAALPAVKGRLQTGTTVLNVGRKGYLKEDGVGDAKRGQQPFRLLFARRRRQGARRGGRHRFSTAPAPTAGRAGWATAAIPAVGERAARKHIAAGIEGRPSGRSRRPTPTRPPSSSAPATRRRRR